MVNRLRFWLIRILITKSELGLIRSAVEDRVKNIRKHKYEDFCASKAYYDDVMTDYIILSRSLRLYVFVSDFVSRKGF